jgi:hypothetical protein
MAAIGRRTAAMRGRRTAMGTILAAALAVAVAAPATAEDAKASKSSVQAAALAKQLARAKLQYIATKDPTEPGRFVAAMHLPGAELMIVSAKYGAPALLNEKVLLGKFQDAYIDLNSASEAATRIIVEDLRADGFALAKSKDMVRDSFEANGKRVVFDFDWRKQKLTQAEYFSTLEAADTQYARMLELLIAEAQKAR